MSGWLAPRSRAAFVLHWTLPPPFGSIAQVLIIEDGLIAGRSSAFARAAFPARVHRHNCGLWHDGPMVRRLKIAVFLLADIPGFAILLFAHETVD